MQGVAAVIIAAGSSSRLGRPKQLVTFGGERLLQRAIRIASESGAERVYVVLGANREEIEAAVDSSGARIVVNELWPEGMASSIRAGIEAMEKDLPGASGVLLMVCDQPHVTPEHLRRMLDAFGSSTTSAIASAYAGRRGIPAVFPREEFGELLALRGDTGARGLLSDPSRDVVEIELEGGEWDIDRAQDLSHLQGL